MSREIKFRMWIVDHGQSPPRDGMYYDIEHFHSTGKLIDYFEEHQVSGEDFLMQYTGLKDKNEKEIYEHDGFIDEEGYGVWVGWCMASSCWALYGTEGHQEDLVCHYVDKMDFSKNIHQHPELLGE